ncbi:hypothetical protein GobsT_53010 [Gemmata obscuriglobus]|nr:hypothetical protein GobsT_53010 [Gemmata obscuriglobus]VTS09820.1 unnamed protein product [Gemmata obscuriglobus UQM 2246]
MLTIGLPSGRFRSFELKERAGGLTAAELRRIAPGQRFLNPGFELERS